jgi:hypothetical protein
MFLPLLTEADPVTSSEGTIDPLGVYFIADSLGLEIWGHHTSLSFKQGNIVEN